MPHGIHGCIETLLQPFLRRAQHPLLLEPPGGDAETAQHRQQDETVPELQPPADGFGEKHAGSDNAVAVAAAGLDEIVSELFPDIRHVHIEQIGKAALVLIKQMLV